MTKKTQTIEKNIPSGWVETVLGEVVETNISSIGKDFEFDKILYLDTGSITENRVEQLQIFSISEAPSRAKRLVKENDIVYSTVRPNQRHFGFIQNPQENLVVSTGFTVISAIPEKTNSKFLYYFFTQDKITSNLQQIAEHSTSTYPSIKPEHIENLEILLPSLPEQQSIASVLSAFDDKIDLLREENKTLEEIGQVIFKEWFGKYSVDDELPEGWRVGKLCEICNLKSGFAFVGDDFVEKSNTMVLKIKDLKGNWIVDLSDISFAKDEVKNLERVQYFKLKVGDIVLAMSGNTTGKIGVIPNLEEELFLNQRVGKFFINDEKYKTFIYFFLMSGNYEEKILAMGYGSAQPNINPTQIENINIIYPDNKTLENFINTTIPIFTKILDNLYQIQSLARSRDELLPKLMGGEVRVTDF
ncbi:MAG: restriction endonuclease subunit S [Patescibacteria group bacterium]|nr:restriction endonuclease subunit S [Patescibacteria group bacterium]